MTEQLLLQPASLSLAFGMQYSDDRITVSPQENYLLRVQKKLLELGTGYIKDFAEEED